MYFSVITAASRDVATLERLRSHFRAQTFTDFEHIVVYDGPPPEDVRQFFVTECRRFPNVRFAWLAERDGQYGTGPRNRGIELSQGKFLIFADDDDVYHPDYLRAFHRLDLDERTLGVVRMNNYGTVISRHALRRFPEPAHIGTPQCAFPAAWFRGDAGLRWDYRGGYDHDYEFVKRSMEQFHPRVKLSPRVLVHAGNEQILAQKGITGELRERYLNINETSWRENLCGPATSDAWLARQIYWLLGGRGVPKHLR